MGVGREGAGPREYRALIKSLSLLPPHLLLRALDPHLECEIYPRKSMGFVDFDVKKKL